MLKRKTTIAVVPASLIQNKVVSFGAKGLYAVLQQLEGKHFSITDFAQEHGVPHEYVANMLEELFHEGFMDLHFGYNGEIQYVINA